jgi:hypothetical protein
MLPSDQAAGADSDVVLLLLLLLLLLLQGAEPEQVAEELMGARAAVGERLEGAKVRACCCCCWWSD